jgi:hypothetical protein
VPSPTAAQKRLSFREANAGQTASQADALAEQVGVPAASRLALSRTRSERFVWYGDDDTLTLVVGEQEGAEVDTALAVGLAERGQRELRLVLPRGWHEPTLHRWAWLRDDLPLRVWSHVRGVASSAARPARQQSQDLVHGTEKPMLHVGERTSWVESLMRWAGAQPDLDASHRPDVRAWQCRGQRVLRIKPQGAGLEVIAGINWGAASPNMTPTPLLITGPLTSSQEAVLREQVLAGCAQRLSGVAKKADEHWLQAVLRRYPRELGLEQPVLRELAAWRPSGSLGTRQTVPRGRGFVDLAGLDGTGTVLLVETKLGGDHMLILQGLDYLIWAEANPERLTLRLDCRADAPFEIAYCVGGKDGGLPAWSSHAGQQLKALAPDLRWHIQEVTEWTGDAARSRRGEQHTYPLPGAAA